MTNQPPSSTNAALIRQLLADRPMPCPACGYQLQGIASDRCPECGVRLHIQVKGRGRVWLSWSLAMFAFLAAAALCVPEVYGDWVRNIKYSWRAYQRSGHINVPFAAEHAIFTTAVIAIALLIIFRKRLFRRRARTRWSVPIVGAVASLFAVVVVFDFYLLPQPRLYGISAGTRKIMEQALAEAGAVQRPGVREIATITYSYDWGIDITRMYIDSDGALAFGDGGYRTTDPFVVDAFNRLYESQVFETTPRTKCSQLGTGGPGFIIRSGHRGAMDAIGDWEIPQYHSIGRSQDHITYRKQFIERMAYLPDDRRDRIASWHWGYHEYFREYQQHGEWSDSPPEFHPDADYFPLDSEALALMPPYDQLSHFRDTLHAIYEIFAYLEMAKTVNENIRAEIPAYLDDYEQRTNIEESIQAWITHHAATTPSDSESTP